MALIPIIVANRVDFVRQSVRYLLAPLILTWRHRCKARILDIIYLLKLQVRLSEQCRVGNFKFLEAQKFRKRDHNECILETGRNSITKCGVIIVSCTSDRWVSFMPE